MSHNHRGVLMKRLFGIRLSSALQVEHINVAFMNRYIVCVATSAMRQFINYIDHRLCYTTHLLPLL